MLNSCLNIIQTHFILGHEHITLSRGLPFIGTTTQVVLIYVYNYQLLRSVSHALSLSTPDYYRVRRSRSYNNPSHSYFRATVHLWDQQFYRYLYTRQKFTSCVSQPHLILYILQNLKCAMNENDKMSPVTKAYRTEPFDTARTQVVYKLAQTVLKQYNFLLSLCRKNSQCRNHQQ